MCTALSLGVNPIAVITYIIISSYHHTAATAGRFVTGCLDRMSWKWSHSTEGTIPVLVWPNCDKPRTASIRTDSVPANTEASTSQIQERRSKALPVYQCAQSSTLISASPSLHCTHVCVGSQRLLYVKIQYVAYAGCSVLHYSITIYRLQCAALLHHHIQATVCCTTPSPYMWSAVTNSHLVKKKSYYLHCQTPNIFYSKQITAQDPRGVVRVQQSTDCQ
jgi:hypothetical protein